MTMLDQIEERRMLTAAVLVYLAIAVLVFLFMHDPRKVARPLYRLDWKHATVVVALRTAIPLLWLPLVILVPLVVLLEPLWGRLFRSAVRD
jgi:hypothetical protein